MLLQKFDLGLNINANKRHSHQRAGLQHRFGRLAAKKGLVGTR